MKKIRSLGLLAIMVIILSACGAKQDADVFGKIQNAKSVGVRGSGSENNYWEISDERYVKEVLNLLSKMKFEEVDTQENSDRATGNFDHPELLLSFACDNEPSINIAFASDKYCKVVNEYKDYEITYDDDKTYERLKQFAYKKCRDRMDIIDAGTIDSESGDDSENNTESHLQAVLDKDNHNYSAWIEGVCGNLASVPDKGDVEILENDYQAYESIYKIENVTDNDFSYLVDKYEKEGFNEDEVKINNEFMAYSDLNYIAMALENDYILLTVGGDLRSTDRVSAGWEDGIYNLDLPKPEYGDCYLLQNYFLHDSYYNVGPYSYYVFEGVDKKQTEEYIEICKSNGYSAPSNDADKADYDIYWVADSSDGRSQITIMHNTENNYMLVNIDSLGGK